MLGAPAEVDQLLLMPQRETATPADMSRIGGGGRVSFAQGVGQGRIADHARPSTIADRLEFVVPVSNRQPNLYLNAGIAGRLECHGYAAECGQIRVRVSTLAFLIAGRLECTRVDYFRRCDGRVGQRNLAEVVAGSRRCGPSGGSRNHGKYREAHSKT